MIRCCQCGNDETFAIEATQHVTAYVEQQKERSFCFEVGDLEIYDTKIRQSAEWEEQDECRCLVCGYVATVEALRVSAYLSLIDASVS